MNDDLTTAFLNRPTSASASPSGLAGKGPEVLPVMSTRERDARLHSCFTGATPNFFGKPLRAPSLGDLLDLEYLGNRFFTGGYEVDEDDPEYVVAMAAWLAQPEEERDELERPEPPPADPVSLVDDALDFVFLLSRDPAESVDVIYEFARGMMRVDSRKFRVARREWLQELGGDALIDLEQAYEVTAGAMKNLNAALFAVKKRARPAGGTHGAPPGKTPGPRWLRRIARWSGE